MDEVIKIWGGRQFYHSGVRTAERQRELYDTPSKRPVAFPGCSQHQFGFAVDVSWFPIMNFADNIGMSGPATNRLMEDLGRHIGLVTVANDVGHFQIYPGSTFRPWAIASGFCNPNPPPSGTQLRLLREAAQDRRDAEGRFGPTALFGNLFFRRGVVF